MDIERWLRKGRRGDARPAHNHSNPVSGVEPLEARLLLNADLAGVLGPVPVGSGSARPALVVDLNGDAGDPGVGLLSGVAEPWVIDSSAWGARGLTLVRSGSILHVYETGTTDDVQPAQDIDGLSNLVITGRADQDDILVVDFSGGDPLPPGGLSYDGGAGGHDSLVLTGGGFATASYVFHDAHSGSICLDGLEGSAITYAGLEPITSTITATHVSLWYSDASEVIAVCDSGTAGWTTVASTAGETVTFENPTESLTIHAGGGHDTIRLDGLGSGFAADLTIDGGAGQDSIVLYGPVDTGGGDLTLTATNGVTAHSSLATGGGILTVEADSDGDGIGSFTLADTPGWRPQLTVWPSDTAFYGYQEVNGGFGQSVAISSDTMVVGAYLDRTTGMHYAGAAYVYTRVGTLWLPQQKLTASDPQEWDQFGYSVAIDGDTIVVGANYDDGYVGAAYVFTRTGTTWTLQQKLTASDGATYGCLGWSVAISDDTVAVGARDVSRGSGAAYVFTRSEAVWTERQKLIGSDPATDDQFGSSIAIDGSTIAVGAYRDDDGGPDFGSVYVFTGEGATWSQQQKLMASDAATNDRFGYSVALDGDTIAVGAYLDDDGGDSSGSVYVFTREGATWSQQQKLTLSDAAAADWFGIGVALNGDTIAVGASGRDDGGNNSGAVYVFTPTGMVWSQEGMISGPVGGRFGATVSISGDTLVGGLSSSMRSAYVCERSSSLPGGSIDAGSGTVEIAAARVDLAGPVSGAAVTVTAADGVTVNGAVATGGGALSLDADNDGDGVGTLTIVAAPWSLRARLWDGELETRTDFGYAVAMAGDTIVVGAHAEWGDTVGSVCVFQRIGTVWTRQVLTAPDLRAGDYFGFCVATDGDTVVVGAPGVDYDGTGIHLGSAFVFTWTGTTWRLEDQIWYDTGALHAAHVAVSGDALLVDGDLYAWDPGARYWRLVQNYGSPDSIESIALDGGTMVVNGNVYRGSWQDLGTGGSPVAIQGDVIVAGGVVFRWTAGTGWVYEQTLADSDLAGDVAIGGDTIVLRTTYGPMAVAQVFRWTGTTWSLEQVLPLPGGACRAVGTNGDTVVVGDWADNYSGQWSGTAYLYERSGSASGGSLAAGAGTITIRAADVELGGSLRGSGSLALIPSTTDASIGVGGAGTFRLDATELALLSDGFSDITVGDVANGTGTVDIYVAIFQDPVTIAGGIIHSHGYATDLTAPTVTFDGNVSPGQSPGGLAVVGNVVFADGSAFTVEIASTSILDGLHLSGAVTIGSNVTLSAVSWNGYVPAMGDTFMIIRNDDTDPVSGTFQGLPEGALIADFLGSGLPARISYRGGDGNDVVLTVVPVDQLVTVTLGMNRYDLRTRQTSIQMTIRNTSALTIQGPVWIVIKSISDGTVALASYDGVTDDGYLYIDVTSLLGDGLLSPGETISTWLRFSNPQRRRFTFTYSIRGLL